MFFLPPWKPVYLAAIWPDFCPGQASLLMVLGCPICWWLPPPWGCSTGFMATPLTYGQFFLLFLNFHLAVPAFRSGLSVLPPPAIRPIMALDRPEIVFLCPEGSLILVFMPSSECPIIVAEQPPALAKAPLSPGSYSTLHTVVPSGILFTGRTLPVWTSAMGELWLDIGRELRNMWLPFVPQ